MSEIKDSATFPAVRPNTGWVNTEKKTIIAFRLIIGLAVFALFIGQQELQRVGWQFYFIGTLFVASNLLFYFENDKTFSIERIQLFVLLFDLAMISVLAVYLSAAKMEFYVVLFLTVFIAAASKKLVYAFGASILMGALYFLLESRHGDATTVLTTSFFSKLILFFCISCFVGYISDLAESRKTNLVKMERYANNMTEVAVEQNRMAGIGVLAGGVAHEFNNIIAGIQGYLELAEMEAVDKDELLKVIFANCNRASGIIKDLLTYSRKSGVNESGVAAVPVIEQVLRMLAKESKNRNVEFEFTPQDVPPIPLPEGLYDRIVLNIIKNALVVSKANTKVKIDIALVDDAVRLSVSDTSEGHLSEKIVNLLDTSCGIISEESKVAEPINGIDLAVTKYLVCDFDGEFTVKTNEDSGTTIEVSFKQTNQPEDEVIEDINNG